jgi:flagellar biosynthesis component FlhA
LTAAVSEDQAEEWYRRITEELGLPLPPMVLSSGEVTGEKSGDSEKSESVDRDGDDQPANKLSLLIDGRVVGVGDFYPGQVQTLRRHWTLVGRTPPESNPHSHNEALRECVVWVSQNELDELEWKRESTPFDEAVRNWLNALLRQNVAELFTLQELMPLISAILNQGDPSLNRHDFLRTVSGNELALWQVLVNLARERVPLHGRLVDLMVELQEVVTQTGQTNTVLLTQRLREQTRHTLCRAFADQTNQLPVMLFGEATESTLIEHLGVNKGQPAFALKSEQAVELAAAISGHFETVVQTEDATPVLVCEEELRSPLFRMIQHFDPRIYVLSYTELSEDVQPRSYGVISGLSFETSQ